MDRTGYAAGVAAIVAMAALLGGCSSSREVSIGGGPTAPVTAAPVPDPMPAPSAAPRPSPTAVPAPAVVTPGGTSGRHGGRDRTAPVAGGLPADWPADIPVPPGTITGSTGAAGQWTVQLLTSGSARTVLASTRALYVAAGFRAASDSLLSRGRRHLTLVVENRDHSPTETIVVVAVATF